MQEFLEGSPLDLHELIEANPRLVLCARSEAAGESGKASNLCSIGFCAHCKNCISPRNDEVGGDENTSG